MTPLDHALAYAALGWRVAPVPPGFKYPQGMPDWQVRATTARATLVTWFARTDTGVCIVTGDASGIFVVDVDPRHDGDETLADLVHEHGPLPDTVECLTGGGGRHLYFAMPAGASITNDAGKRLGPGLDVRGEGGQVVAPPTVHPETGARYEWEASSDPLDGARPAEAPMWLVELLVTPPATATPRRTAAPSGHRLDLRPGDRFEAETEWADLLMADGWTLHSARHGRQGDYELWTRPGKDAREGASASLYYQGSDVLKVFSSSIPSLAVDATYTRFGYVAATRHGGDHAAFSRELAARYRRDAVLTDTRPPASDGADPEARTGHQYTDLGNARRLVDAHGDDLRYAPQLGQWLAWDGHRWAPDVTGEAQRRAKRVVDAMYTEISLTEDRDERKRLFGHWLRSQGAARLEAMVSVARTEPGIPVTVAELDADPWAFNTLEGVVDLRTGQLRAADRRALVTKLAGVAYDPAATCPTWEAFVTWAMCGDEAMVRFLQRAVGYSLTGLVSEQVLFFGHGQGENGKSTFLTTLQALLGDYAIAAEPNLLVATEQERHTTGIADLVGRRMAVIQEADEGRRLAEATVKQLTGGDTIRARRMRQDNFEFRPTFKLWMAANHRPVVRGTDHAIWRRIRLIPFAAQLAPGQRDDHLVDKLTAELPGILNWAIEGCREWQRAGLQPPAGVVEATAAYRSEQDHVGRFVDDICRLGDEWVVTAADLRRAYELWCTENGERPWSAKAMAPQLVERGCVRVKDRSSKSSWVGITLDGDPTKATQAHLFNSLNQRNGARSEGDDESTARDPEYNGARAKSADQDVRDTAPHCPPFPGSPLAHARTEREPDNGVQGARPVDHDDELGLF